MMSAVRKKGRITDKLGEISAIDRNLQPALSCRHAYTPATVLLKQFVFYLYSAICGASVDKSAFL